MKVNGEEKMWHAKARVKLYTRKQVKNSRTYYFRQAVAVIQARTLQGRKLEEIDGEEVVVTDEETLVLARAGEILIKFFLRLPDEVLREMKIENKEEEEILKQAIKIVLGGGK